MLVKTEFYAQGDCVHDDCLWMFVHSAQGLVTSKNVVDQFFEPILNNQLEEEV